MRKRSKTHPYTNARREGRTNPDLVEFIERNDPRHWSQGPQFVPNRADLRARGLRGPRVRRFIARCRRAYRGEAQA